MDRITKAFDLAYHAHKGQTRKMTDLPYIIHPMEVVLILIKNGASDETIIAGMLHDVIEDTDITLKEIQEKFGDKITRLVNGASEPGNTIHASKKELIDSWTSRKKHSINFIKSADVNMKMLSCADKLANVQSMTEDLKVLGEKLWSKFNSSKDEQKWYYNSMVDGRNGKWKIL